MTAADTRGRRTGLISNFLPELSSAPSVVDHGIPPQGAGRYKSISRAILLADRREGVIYNPMPSFRSDLLLHYPRWRRSLGYEGSERKLRRYLILATVLLGDFRRSVAY